MAVRIMSCKGKVTDKTKLNCRSFAIFLRSAKGLRCILNANWPIVQRKIKYYITFAKPSKGKFLFDLLY